MLINDRLGVLSRTYLTRSEVLEVFRPDPSTLTTKEHALNNVSPSKTATIEGTEFYPVRVDGDQVRFECKGLLLSGKSADDVAARERQLDQCRQSLTSVTRDLEGVMTRKSVAMDGSKENEPELADVGAWFIEQRRLQEMIQALTTRKVQNESYVKSGPSFSCTIGKWTLVGGGTWVYVIG